MSTAGGTMTGANVPTGSGSERIKIIKHGGSYSAGSWSILLDGVANHIYTILSISAHNQDGANARTFYLEVSDSDNSSNRCVWIYQSVPSGGTFVYNDRTSIIGDDHLRFYGESGSDFEVYVTYIDQDWT